KGTTPVPELHKAVNPYIPPVPFPNRLKLTMKDKEFSSLYNMLSKVNINLPLLDLIKNVPTYAKFFKELITNKAKYEKEEKLLIPES
ncbi:hypothetical protein PSY31_23245, partial [Shigella flexneri]|nr:hypothetical protein [Shigella flexneri]